MRGRLKRLETVEAALRQRRINQDELLALTVRVLTDMGFDLITQAGGPIALFVGSSLVTPRPGEDASQFFEQLLRAVHGEVAAMALPLSLAEFYALQPKLA